MIDLRAFAMLFGVFLLTPAHQALAQSNNWIDENAIRRGYEVSAYCNDNHNDDLTAKMACQERGLFSVVGDRFALLGFFYHSFVIDALTLEIWIRRNPKLPKEIIDASSNTIKASLKGLRKTQDQTFLGIDRICIIVRGNCALADRLYREWVPRLPAQEVVR